MSWINTLRTSAEDLGALAQEESSTGKKWYGTYDCKPDGSWNRTAAKMLLSFAGSGHSVFRGTSALERRELRRKGGGETSIHFNGRT